MKRCAACRYDLPLDEFERNRKGVKHRNVCRRCDHLGRRYGITRADYDRLFAAQGGRCGVCRCDPASALRGLLFVDHDHTTGVVRGLLCYGCNTAIGALGDTKAGLLRALAYLEGS